ncbi:interleukin-23 receptor isoform X2 [Siniperca chuatsi]|uniref:interleukin-23 receptor isoform X2 n=1 Tax=Siniperca chuatsi TaxID=119488 RepID=UPI001CE1A237|nr:interleukin-23 receptor isoform X2 [Siniperca chuatsi]XP_044056759.1 interleukin-23 receptor isoform X2 [Siniperca chuatsi]
MNLYSTIWRLIIILLSFSIKRCPLLPAGSQRFNGLGYLTVEPAPLFLIGANLTVYCHVRECKQGFKISLELNGKIVAPWKKVNCTTMIFNLFNVKMPQSMVLCKRTKDQLTEIVNGQDLYGGLPPDKPENIICEMTRSSDFTHCTWERGQETYLPTTYNVSVNRENETQILLHQIQDAEEISIPRSMIDENTQYQLIITAYNHFGASQSDLFILCVKDIVIPETPRIMQIEFGNNSAAAMLHWKTSESSDHLRSDVRLRADNGSWEVGEGTELSEGLIQVAGLKPLTEYEFQMRTCNSTSGLTHINTPSFMCRSTSSRRSFCSIWSLSVRGKSPGKGPSQQLHVWSMLGSQGANGLPMVTVLWKPPSPEDYSREVQQYKIFLGNGQKQEVTCHAALSQCSVQVPADVQALSISAVTLYGTSPPADVPLRHSGDFGPVLRKLAPAANGSAVSVSWLSPGDKYWLTSGGKLLHYVLEWTSVPVAQLQWQKLAKDQNNTSVTGLTAGVRYNISLYAVTTRGVSAPSSGLVYSKEQKPVSGPKMSALVHKARWIWIQWDELPVDQRRGFITHYTIYIQTLDSSNPELSVTLSGSGPRQKWLDCPDGALALQLTASTSAGEGPRGSRISSQPATPAVGLVIVLVFIITLFVAIISNLMCWSCVRERIKLKCISWGPAWFDENLPKPGNSLAIRLLEQYGSEPSFPSTYSDPPLSPISFISQDKREDVYPNIHIEISQVGSERPTGETPLLMSDAGTILVDSRLENVSYKPQIATVAPEGDEVKWTEEEQRDVPTSGEEDRCSSAFGGLLGGLLSSVELDFSDSPLGLTLSSVSGVLWPKTPETTSVLDGGLLLRRRGTENNVEADSPSLDLQQGETMTPDTADTCLCQYTLETTLTGGYFPQAATL